MSALVIAATSGIGRAVALELARAGHDLVVTSRDAAEIERVAADLRLRGGRAVHPLILDVAALDTHAALVTAAREALSGRIDIVVCSAGVMYPNDEARLSAERLSTTMMANLTGVAHCLERCADQMERGGVIAAISSVAGDRGRQSNYVYGAAKAGLIAYCSGLRNRLFSAGIHVVTAKPGFVATAMTHGLINPKSPLVASPERVARGLVRAIRRRRNVVYLPWFWWGIMSIIGSVPEWLFKRLRL
jgi:decaprenylphospho-beta-D-erythro-pentofuranosid-2-ulose 2-reductase